MLTKVGTITVHVTDQDKALAFYTEQLGFETRADMPMGPDQRWIEVARPGAQTRILLGSGSYENGSPFQVVAMQKQLETGFVHQP